MIVSCVSLLLYLVCFFLFNSDAVMSESNDLLGASYESIVEERTWRNIHGCLQWFSIMLRLNYYSELCRGLRGLWAT